MKRALIVLIFLLFLGLCLAGNMYQIDFSTNDINKITLGVEDIVKFDFPVRVYKEDGTFTLENKEQIIRLRKVDEKRQLADLTVFIEGAETPSYPAVTKNQIIKVDFERDDIHDLIIRLEEIKGNSATLILQKVSEEEKPEKIEGVTEEVPSLWSKLKEFFSDLFNPAKITTEQEVEKEPEEIGGVEEGLEEVTGEVLAGEKAIPGFVMFFAKNWIISLIIIIVLIILAWNRRAIGRRIRRSIL